MVLDLHILVKHHSLDYEALEEDHHPIQLSFQSKTLFLSIRDNQLTFLFLASPFYKQYLDITPIKP